MTVVNGYCTAAEVRGQFHDSGARLDDPLIERAINAASRAIDSHCGRRFWQDATPVARLYRPRDGYSVTVHDIADSTITVETDDNLDGTWLTTWAADEFDLEPRNADVDANTAHSWTRLVAVDDRCFPRHGRRATLRITATWGWSEVPVDVAQACILKASSLFKRKDAPFGVAGFNDFGPVRITRNDPDVVGLLQGFVRFASPEV